MLRFFKGDDGSGLAIIEREFVAMLADARRVFDLAVDARVAGVDPASIAAELNTTEDRTDESERDIRRRVLVHASTHGSAADLPSCLRYMSVAKDAERIADLSKQLFSIAESIGAVGDPATREDLLDLARTLSPLITAVADAFAADDVERARGIITDTQQLRDRCRERIDALLREDVDVPYPAATTLTYRQLQRVAANITNIASSIVLPLDAIDYPGAGDGDERV